MFVRGGGGGGGEGDEMLPSYVSSLLVDVSLTVSDNEIL